VQQTPPNNVIFRVYSLVAGEDRVLVTNAEGNGIDFDQMTLNTGLSAVDEDTIDVGTGNIPEDTPATGTLRVELNSGKYMMIAYTSHDSDDEFTIAATDFSGDNADIGNNVFISYIDKLATTTPEEFTLIYDEARTLFVRVRDGGATPIKTFETTASLGEGGGSATAIRTSDA